jgi:uncharacterized protein YbjQ (UPF0145 family)
VIVTNFILQNVDLVVFLVLLAVGYFAGRAAESGHFRSIRKRERQLAGILMFATKFPPAAQARQSTALVSGSVVISSDYFKLFVASLRKLFGGRFRVYETLLDRARREAVLRMKREALRLGGHAVFNVKFETFNVTMGARGGVAAVEVLAYGTALIDPKK